MSDKCPYCKDFIDPDELRVEIECWQEEARWEDEPIEEGPIQYHAGCLMDLINTNFTYNRKDVMKGNVVRPQDRST